MSLGETGAPIVAPKNEWTPIATGKSEVYVQNLAIGNVRLAIAASEPTDPPGETQGAYSFSGADGIVPFPSINPANNVYVYPVDLDATLIVTTD